MVEAGPVIVSVGPVKVVVITDVAVVVAVDVVAIVVAATVVVVVIVTVGVVVVVVLTSRMNNPELPTLSWSPIYVAVTVTGELAEGV